MSYIDFFYHTLSDAPFSLESPIRFIKIKNTQFQVEPMIDLRTAEDVLAVLRFPADETGLPLSLVGKAFECRCGGVSSLGSPIALTFKDLVSLPSHYCLPQINNRILLRKVHHVCLYKRPSNAEVM